MEAVGTYRLSRLLETSGTVEIYVAVDERLGREVRVRILRPGATEEEKRDFEAAAREEARGGAGTVSVHELGRSSEGRPYAVYEEAAGGGAVPGAGEASVETKVLAGSASPARLLRRRRIAAALAVLALVVAGGALALLASRRAAGPARRLLVLPLAVTGFPTEEAWIGEAMADSLRAGLGRLRSLSLGGGGLGGLVADSPDPAAEAAKQGFDLLLRGSLVRESGEERVSLECLDLGKGRVLWSRKAKTEAGKILSTARGLCDSLVAGLGLRFRSDEEHRAYAAAFRDPEAVALNLQANEAALSGTLEGRKRMVELYQRSLAVDPGQLDVLRSLWRGCAILAELDRAESASWKAKSAEYKALAYERLEAGEVDPYWAARLEAYKAGEEGRREDEVAVYRRALEIVPNDFAATNNLSIALVGLGRLREAKELLSDFLERDPYWIQIALNLSYCFMLSGEYEAGLALADRWLVDWQPDHADLLENAGLCLYGLGRAEEAAARFEKVIGQGYVWDAYLLAAARLGSGAATKGEAEALAERGLEGLGRGEANPAMLFLLRELGRTEDFFAYAKGGLAVPRAGLEDYLAYSPAFDEYRRDPRWAELAAANPIKGPEVRR